VKRFKIIISGGGTGGHIFPAISIALGLKKRFPKSNILFVGAINKMEMEIVPKYNFKIKGLLISGFKRSISFYNLLFPLKIVFSLIQSFFIIKKFKPDIVIGTGGFASGPILIISQVLKIPNVIQEQNSFPGLTNKILSKRSNLVFVAFDGMEKYFNNNRVLLVGNPVRKFDNLDKLNHLDLKNQYSLNVEKKILFVLGGSLGAKKINEFLRDKLTFFKKNNFQILWQTGKKYYNEFKKFSDKDVKVLPFIEDINKIFSIADIIISRAGAITLSELCFSKSPVFLIPSPNVTANHQYYNALVFERKKAAILIEESKLNKEFESEFINLINDNKRQKNMIKNLNKLSKPDSVNSIINEILKLVKC